MKKLERVHGQRARRPKGEEEIELTRKREYLGQELGGMGENRIRGMGGEGMALKKWSEGYLVRWAWRIDDVGAGRGIWDGKGLCVDGAPFQSFILSLHTKIW